MRAAKSSDTVTTPEDLSEVSDLSSKLDELSSKLDELGELSSKLDELSELSSKLESLSIEATKVSLKLLVDVKGQRVLFAEAGKDFVDFLFNIMSLPVGTVVRLLNKKGMVGSLGSIYGSIERLSYVYMQSFQDKDILLKPKVLNSAPTNLTLLLPDIESSNDPKHKGFYRCSGYDCRSYIAEDPEATCLQCRSRQMSSQVILIKTEKKDLSSSSEAEGGFVKGVVKYMVMDDLTVEPMSAISSIALLNRFNIKDVGVLQEKTIKIGMDEAVRLLKASLQSNTVLTDVFFVKKANV
ncbi:hypothetical protein DITRI_Ditri09bG0119900 [Diplodiscus trichospermus]